MMHSFLMIGQSNMAGRGYLKDVKQIYDEQVKTLINGRWHTMTEPINFDRPTSGVSLAASFAASWRLTNMNDQIGLIPCADGGSSLDDWAIDGALFENAIFHAKVAQRSSELSGFLWHQGENDSFGGRPASYEEKLTTIVNAFRQELNVPEIPFIAGGLGDYLQDGRYGQYFTEYREVNAALDNFTKSNSNCYFVDAAGLTANADGLHFDAMSLRRLGVRYHCAFVEKKSIYSELENELELVSSLQDRPMSKAEKAALLEISFAKGEISLLDLESQL